MSSADISKPRIRPVEAANIADLIRIGEETNLSRWTAQNYLDEMKNPLAIMLRLIDEANSTLGFIVGRVIIGDQIERSADAEIYNIAVSKTEQCKGHGQRLYDEFAAICRSREVVHMWLEVRESNKAALAFYRRNGFAAVQTRNNFYDNPREHAILMKAEL